ncbi:hypothetical protein [Hoeflea prorocentri]|uniref:Pentapeptide repeat-containing protein n=1 Tax=Hoeflea prorocentri TaxID=1922333 RepID=A0A9X3UFI2_9HYPH|nr:hypothetical protein [Hoeflea prorocentri]MCY6379766.1 hypothetical protein [Hoeflea prorocentri]MDA5397566.1 hypothetical protein [Hoeflea prorocentri]
MTSVAGLLADFQRPWRHGEHVDATGLVIEEPLVLDGLTVRGIDLSGAKLKGGLSARRTRFRGLAWLCNAEVQGQCDLTGAHFRTDFRADGLTADKTVLDDCVVQGVLSLAGSNLDSLSVRNALIMAHMTLEDAHIAGISDMTGAELLGGFWAAGGKLGPLELHGTEISGRVRLTDRQTASA